MEDNFIFWGDRRQRSRATTSWQEITEPSIE